MKTSDSDKLDYWKQDENNVALAMDMLKKFFPELFNIEDLRQKMGVPHMDLAELIYCIRLIQNHGYGNVQVAVTNGKIHKIEATIRSIRGLDTQEKLNKQEV